MEKPIDRREFLCATATAIGALAFATTTSLPVRRPRSSFQISVLTDEISKDFDLACRIASGEFGLEYVELRAMWGKNIVKLDDAEVRSAREVLQKYRLKVTAIAGPLYKCDLPGAPVSKFSPNHKKGAATGTFDDQKRVLEREIELAEIFETKHIRCFDFWRLDDPAPHRPVIHEKLHEAAEAAHKRDLVLVLENEHACNTATGEESARTLKAVPHPAFKLIWDPGNEFFAGSKPYPDGYSHVPVDRIGHLHCKDAKRLPEGKPEFTAMGDGEIDWAGQFRALKQDGFRGPVTLETHWKGAGSTEDSSRQSMAGMFKLLRSAGALD